MSSSKNPRKTRKVVIRRLVKISAYENTDVMSNQVEDVWAYRWKLEKKYSTGETVVSYSHNLPNSDDALALYDLVYTGHKGGRFTWKLRRKAAQRIIESSPNPEEVFSF